ncbi:unnamed protein product [Malus baccata var. baccata]
MEDITDGVNNITTNASDSHKKNRIQVSNTKKPLFFYVNLAKYNEVELSALGMAGVLRSNRLLLALPPKIKQPTKEEQANKASKVLYTLKLTTSISKKFKSESLIKL